MKRVFLATCLLLLPCAVQAQTPTVNPPVTAVRFVISGGVSPVTNDLPVASLTSTTNCAVPSGTVPNPSAFQYKVNLTDANCWQYTDPGNGPLLSLPVGGTVYTSTLAYVNSNGAGPVSTVSNSFSRPGVLPTSAPAALRVVP